MPIALEGAVPPPHLHLNTASPWSPYNSHYYPPASSPAPMTPDSISSYAPRLHESPSQEGGVPSSGWFAPSAPAPSTQNEGAYNPYTYNQPYVNPHPATHFSHQRLAQVPDVPVVPTSTSIEHPAGNYSPVSQCSRGSEGPRQDFIPHSNAQSPGAPTNITAPIRPRSSPAGEYSPWTMNPIGMHPSASMHPHQQQHQNHFYPSSTYPSMRSPLLSEPGMELNVELSVSQQRRMYAPIAPHPRAPGTSAPIKRSHDDSEEQAELSKRRKRSDSTTSATIELGEEDKLLLKLKDEESMPWKDIAARFQSDLGKTYQIPALQMRLKRLRERMRVWTETDVKALRMAHEYWVQNKFDIISQKMLEYGAAEKWTARQCARKWTEVDTVGPTPYSYEYHNSYAPIQLSPIEANHYMPYVHIQ